MNKHHLTTIVENGKYVGLITKNDEIVFKTEPKNTPNEASAAMTKYIQQSGEIKDGSGLRVRPQPRPSSIPPSAAKQTAPSPVPVASNAPAPIASVPRKCCGRR